MEECPSYLNGHTLPYKITEFITTCGGQICRISILDFVKEQVTNLVTDRATLFVKLNKGCLLSRATLERQTARQ